MVEGAVAREIWAVLEAAMAVEESAVAMAVEEDEAGYFWLLAAGASALEGCDQGPFAVAWESLMDEAKAS